MKSMMPSLGASSCHEHPVFWCQSTGPQGVHPEYHGTSDVRALGMAERFFADVALRVPRLEQRLAAAVYMKSAGGAVEEAQVCV